MKIILKKLLFNNMDQLLLNFYLCNENNGHFLKTWLTSPMTGINISAEKWRIAHFPTTRFYLDKEDRYQDTLCTFVHATLKFTLLCNCANVNYELKLFEDSEVI